MKPIIHQTPIADLRAENRIVQGCPVRDIQTIDSELRSVAALRRAARERGGSLPSIVVADALLDERRELTEWVAATGREFSQFPM
jgi:hypothetical protein